MYFMHGKNIWKIINVHVIGFNASIHNLPIFILTIFPFTTIIGLQIMQ